MYGTAFEVSDEVMGKDFLIPLGKAKIQRPGKHVTICAFSKMVGYSLEAAEKLAQDGIDVEVSEKSLFFWDNLSPILDTCSERTVLDLQSEI